MGKKDDLQEVLTRLIGGNIGAYKVAQLLIEKDKILDLMYCDYFEIWGTRLYKLYNDSCGKNLNKLNRTLLLFRIGVYSKEEILKNLNLVTAIPFVDDDIKLYDTPTYDREPDFTDPEWDSFCQENQTTFQEKLNEKIKKLSN